MSTDPRTPERIRHHFEVERELAQRLRKSTREERTALFKSLYTELFERVPDHPRLTMRESAEESAQHTAAQLKLIRSHLGSAVTFLEFAPGDCRLSHAAAGLCERVIGVDISDQRSPGDVSPANFELIVYDGYHLPVKDASVDVVFSYQFLEHLHPDDIDAHFELVSCMLKPGGVYIFDTPHQISGPHDVSVHFSKTSECFHFQEWTYRDMFRLLRRHHFAPNHIFRMGREQSNPMFSLLAMTAETSLRLLPFSARHAIARRLLPSVTVVAHRA